MNVGILIYPNVEVLDFAGPFEVLSTANRLSDKNEKFDVFIVSEHLSQVSARGGLKIMPDYACTEHPDIDVLMIPGGVHTPQLSNPVLINWIKQTANQAKLIATVCTGVFLLAESGLINGHSVTTHWQDIDDLKIQYPQLDIISGQRWVESKRVISSAGISAGLDMSLYLVSKLLNLELAERTAKQMEYHWQLTPSKGQ